MQLNNQDLMLTKVNPKMKPISPLVIVGHFCARLSSAHFKLSSAMDQSNFDDIVVENAEK